MAKCTKKCCDCRNVVGNRPGSDFSPGSDFAECRAPENIDRKRMQALRMVGVKNPSIHYRTTYASLQRGEGWFSARFLNYCGKEGRWFKPRNEE